MSAGEAVVADDLGGAARLAAAEVLAHLRAAVSARGRATIALAGGATPATLYRQLAAAGRDDAPWDFVDFFFGDERCVPPDAKQSNYAMARRELLDPLAIAGRSVHRIDADRWPAEAVADAYEAALRIHFHGALPAFDITLLDIGADGHTASLFPGDVALEERRRWAVAVHAPSGYEPAERISLTLLVLNNARAVFFLATGASKRMAVSAARAGGGAPQSAQTPNGRDHAPGLVPAARVRPVGRLVWFLDRAAAGGDD